MWLRQTHDIETIIILYSVTKAMLFIIDNGMPIYLYQYVSTHVTAMNE